MEEKQKYKIYTLGCKLNYAESAAIARSLDAKKLEKAGRGQIADLVIVNSCAVTQQSERKTKELIRRVARENPNTELVVTGCFAKLRPEEILAIKGVSTVQTTKELTAFSLGERTRSFLKVQDGCDYHCTYCTVWRARGKSRNAPIHQIVEQAKLIAEAGVQEIVLTGVNTGDFGRSTGENLLELIQELAQVEGVNRYRISSIEPNLLRAEIIEFCATNPKFMPHFHIPLQSGSNTILKAMGRRYTAELFEEKLTAIRAVIPHVFIGVDVIVGFPGETSEHFKETLALLKRIKPSFLHVFPYSQRPGTPAAKLPDQLSQEEKKHRVKILNELSEELLAEFTAAQMAKPQKVLFEGRNRAGLLFGHTENYIRVETDGDDSLIGQIVDFPIK